MDRLKKIINNQFQKYLDIKSTVQNEADWIREYGYYLFKDTIQYDRWFALVIGPDDTLYTGVLLLVRIIFPTDYPFSPPKIENMTTFPKQFNTNLWSSDVVQNLINNRGDYQPYYGLICMDILNTPHSIITKNQFGVPIEAYDRSKEGYSPIQSIHAIMISMRSNLLTGETKLPHISDQELQFITMYYLTFSIFKISLSGTILPVDITKTLDCILLVYKNYYQLQIKTLINSELMEKQKIIELLDFFQ